MKVTLQPINALNNDLVPEKQHNDDAGYDLKAASHFILRPGCTYVIPCGFRMALESGYEMQIRSRSGLSMRNIVVVNSPGTVDAGYRDEIKVILRNIGDEDEVEINRGTRIAQAVFAKLPEVEMTVVGAGDVLPSSDRGTNGLGSTGI